MAEQQDEVEVNGPGGFKIRARGYDILTLFVVIGIALLGYLFYEHKADAKTAQTEIVKALDKVGDSQVELSYLISLTPEERAKLRLEMPESLRRRCDNEDFRCRH